MQLRLRWEKTRLLGELEADLGLIPMAAGIYVFGRKWGRRFEALYVGRGEMLRGRIKAQLNNKRLRDHVDHAGSGRKVVLIGVLEQRPGQQESRCLKALERGFIEHFLGQGDDLVNVHGTKLTKHTIASRNRDRQAHIPRRVGVR